MKPGDPKGHQCTATNRQGKRCGKAAIPGGAVCRLHGGGAPQVVARAKQRLLEAVDPAAAELVEIATGRKQVKVATKEGVRTLPVGPAVQVRAIEAVLDRAGLPAETKATVDATVTVAEEGRQRLREAFPLESTRKKATKGDA